MNLHFSSSHSVIVYGSAVLRDVPRDTVAPWLSQKSNKWQLVEDLKVLLIAEDGGVQDLVVPAGYITDLSSIPRLFWRMYPPDTTEARGPAIFHDYCYSHLHWFMTKKQADKMFHSALLNNGMSKIRAKIFYRAVRIGGRGGWR